MGRLGVMWDGMGYGMAWYIMLSYDTVWWVGVERGGMAWDGVAWRVVA